MVVASEQKNEIVSVMSTIHRAVTIELLYTIEIGILKTIKLRPAGV
jgi:hypothetical protein